VPSISKRPIKGCISSNNNPRTKLRYDSGTAEREEKLRNQTSFLFAQRAALLSKKKEMFLVGVTSVTPTLRKFAPILLPFSLKLLPVRFCFFYSVSTCFHQASTTQVSSLISIFVILSNLRLANSRVGLNF